MNIFQLYFFMIGGSINFVEAKKENLYTLMLCMKEHEKHNIWQFDEEIYSKYSEWVWIICQYSPPTEEIPALKNSAVLEWSQ